MAILKYYFPKIQYEEILEQRKQSLLLSNFQGFDADSGLTIMHVSSWMASLTTDTPLDFDMSKYELVYTENCNLVNSIDDFDRIAEDENQTVLLQTNGKLRRPFKSGDIVEIDGNKYFYLSSGWKNV